MPIESNPADGPSRGNFGEVVAHGSKATEVHHKQCFMNPYLAGIEVVMGDSPQDRCDEDVVPRSPPFLEKKFIDKHSSDKKTERATMYQFRVGARQGRFANTQTHTQSHTNTQTHTNTHKHTQHTTHTKHPRTLALDPTSPGPSQISFCFYFS